MNVNRTGGNSLTEVLPEADPSVVYMVYCAGKVKIGITRDILRRLSQLRHGSPNPMSLIWLIHGDKRTEQALHKRFSEVRQRGEWFDVSEDMRGFLASRVNSPMRPALLLKLAEANPGKTIGGF